MIKCEVCQRLFPDHLVTRFTCCEAGQDNSVERCCPICALDLRNKVTGLNEKEFQGEQAQWMLEEAQLFIKRHRR